MGNNEQNQYIIFAISFDIDNHHFGGCFFLCVFVVISKNGLYLHRFALGAGITY